MRSEALDLKIHLRLNPHLRSQHLIYDWKTSLWIQGVETSLLCWVVGFCIRDDKNYHHNPGRAQRRTVSFLGGSCLTKKKPLGKTQNFLEGLRMFSHHTVRKTVWLGTIIAAFVTFWAFHTALCLICLLIWVSYSINYRVGRERNV